ncbi:uncharacterized protein [Haliotis cracherodii]|uniref:uncharacterized protein n=1 Tax=Haliotis cracherodii TaxID=6455 RepID=UPI0039E8AE75
MMKATCFLVAALLTCCSAQMGQYCGNVMCPQGFECSYSSMGQGQCVSNNFVCPQVWISNTYDFKSCSGFAGCDPYSEKCCNGVCMTGPSLVQFSNNGWGSGPGGPGGPGIPFSGAEKTLEEGKKPTESR